jgi:hypothetical protein
MTQTNPSSLSDTDLLFTTRQAAGHERDAMARLVSLLSEVDARRLYLGEGYSSMFAFCTRALYMSEHAAYARIDAARAARRFPEILGGLADGRVSLTTVGLLTPHLTDENFESLLEAAQYKSKRDVERLIATLHPQPDIAASIRALPDRTLAVRAAPHTLFPTRDNAPAPSTVAATDVRPSELVMSTVGIRRPFVAPLAPRRYLLRVTIGEDTQRQFERARDLLRHEIPDGDPAVIIDRALTLLVAHAERTKFAATKRSSSDCEATLPARPARPRSRRIPSAIRRAVWKRDQGRCAFAGRDGRCGETGFLEFHHVVPFAAGGSSAIDNLELRCRAHNGYEAERAGLTLWRPAATRSGPS